MRQDGERLKKILHCIAKIERYSAGGENDFFNDELKQDGILRNFQVMGDAVRDLSEEFRTKHPDLPWDEVSGFRNRITHDYFGIKLDLVWEAVLYHLPKFKEQIENIDVEQEFATELPAQSKLKEELKGQKLPKTE